MDELKGSKKTIDEIHAALSKMHARAMGDQSKVYMSIPANPDRDADLILSSAIDELGALRAQVDECYQHLEAGVAHPIIKPKVREQTLLTWFKVGENTIRDQQARLDGAVAEAAAAKRERDVARAEVERLTGALQRQVAP